MESVELDNVEVSATEKNDVTDARPRRSSLFEGEYNPSKKGPIQNRGCTDIVCCLLFTLFFIAMIGVGVFAFIRGDPVKIIYPTDSHGNVCGQGELVDKPHLVFFDLVKCARNPLSSLGLGCPTPQVCVEKCPENYWTWVTLAAKEELTSGKDVAGRREMVCKNYPKEVNVDPVNTDLSVKELVSEDHCAPYLLESTDVLGRCIPSAIGDILKIPGDLVDSKNKTVDPEELSKGTKSLQVFTSIADVFMRVYQDVRVSWVLILICLAAAMLLSLLWIVLMRCMAAPLVWLSIILFLALFAFATYWCISTYVDMKDKTEHQGDFIFTLNLDYYWQLAKTWLALGIICGVFLLIIILVLIFLRTRILISIALIKESSKAVGHMMSTLLWPLIPFFLHLGLFAFWGVSAIYLHSIGKQQGRLVNNDTDRNVTDTICDPNDDSTVGKICDYITYGGDEYTLYLQIYMLFMLFWMMHFIIGLGQTTLAGAFASYYWAFDKSKDIPTFPVASSFWRCLRYHLGSIAFGSLILAIIHMIRVFLEYLESKLKGAENQVAKFLVKCLKCCFWCLEKLLKMLTRNAYIMMAVYGKNFCASAKLAFQLIIRNVVRAFVLDKVTDFLLFIGKLMVVGAIGVPSFFFFSNRIPTAILREAFQRFVPQVNYYMVPVIIVAIGSYMIATSFLGVYNMAVDTLFLCFLQDEEINDGSEEKPYFMSKELKKILSKKNEEPKPKTDPESRM